jgi:tail protein P2 I
MPQVLLSAAGEPAALPDTYTPVSTVGAYLIEALGPWISLHLAWYLDAIGVMFDPIAVLVNPVGFDGESNYIPGYGSLFDAENCPAQQLPYLAQYVGVQIPVGAPEDVARALVIAENGQQRGTLPAVTSAIQRNLSATQSVTILERTYLDGTPDPDWSVIVVRPEEVISLAQLIADVNAIKPMGVFFSVVQTDGWTISEMEAAYPSITALEAAFSTLSNLETDVP